MIIIISILKVLICLILSLLLISGVCILIYELIASIKDCNELDNAMTDSLNKNQDSQK